MFRGEGWLTAWRLLLAVGLVLLLGSAGTASAQEIEPNDFLPLPDGTNINLGYFVYGHMGLVHHSRWDKRSEQQR
jgi:hypothetical protein